MRDNHEARTNLYETAKKIGLGNSIEDPQTGTHWVDLSGLTPEQVYQHPLFGSEKPWEREEREKGK
jgi:hypothetical protein